MKKLFHILPLVAILFTALAPAAPVFASTEQAPEPAPVFQLEEPYWDCVTVPTGMTCPNDSRPDMVFTGTGTDGNINPNIIVRADLICNTADCPSMAYFVYVRVDIDVHGTPGTGSLAPTPWLLRIRSYQGTTTYFQNDVEFPAQTGRITYYLPIKKAQFGPWNGNPTRLETRLYMPAGGVYNGFNADVNVTYSFYPAPCDERFTVIETIADYDIDETIEMPLGPDDLEEPDYQKIPITGGNAYRVETFGGPWRVKGLESLDWYTTSVSFDEGVTWMRLSDIEWLCAYSKPPEPDLMVVYFLAPEEAEYFMIRVDDTIFEDNYLVDEESPMSYRLDLVYEYFSSCSQNFTYGEEDLLTSGTIPANSSSGVTVEIPFPHTLISSATGMPYSFPWVVIETGPDGWYDGGGQERFSALGKWLIPPAPSVEFQIGDDNPENELPTDGLVACAEPILGGGFRVYVQSPNTTFLNLAVNDIDSNYANNTGELDYRIYLAEYVRPAAACEGVYQLGNSSWSGTVDAKAESGKAVGQVVLPTVSAFNDFAIGSWYAIDTQDGPWRAPGVGHGTTGSFEMQISLGTPAGPLVWHDLDTWADAACIVPLDEVGHIRVYFQVPNDLLGAPDGGRAYYLRVKDTDYSTNSGFMGYTVRSVLQVTAPPDEGGQCSQFGYELNTAVADISIPATAANGVLANPTQLLPDNYYLLDVDGGPWYEGISSPEEYGIEISSDNGVTWYAPQLHPSVLCAEDPANTGYKIFIKPQAGELWKFRVASTSFTDNIGNQHITVRPANPDGEIVGTCLADAELAEIATYIVDAKREDGIVIPLVIGEVYAIKIHEGYWRDNAILGPLSAQYYNLDMSVDNATTWEQLHEHSRIDCFQYVSRPLLLGGMARFQPQTGETIRLRVANGNPGTDGDWSNNGYGVTVKIYAVTNADDSNIGDIPVITGLGDACMDMAIRPTSILDLAGWVMYGFDSFRLYIAWCPRHNAAIQAIFSLFGQYEPFATMASFITFYNTTKAELDSYNWTNSDVNNSPIATSDAQTMGTADAMLSQPESSNPWQGGPVKIRDTSKGNFSTYCNSALKPYLGARLADPYCFAGNMMKSVGVNLWFQVMVDIMAVAALLIYIVFRIIKPAMT